MQSNEKKMDIKRILDTEILTGVSPRIKDILNHMPDKLINGLEEIRIRLDKPLMIYSAKSDYMLCPSGACVSRSEDAYRVTREDCERTMQLLSNYSVYAVEEELRNGYITLKGGHRVGMVGKGILEGGRVKALKNICGFNIRIAREVPGAADGVVPYIVKGDSDIYNTMIISPPQCGKTTLLRDIIRQLSCGIESYKLRGMKVGVVDERSEIAGSYQGIPQNDVGYRTDVLDGCPKSYGLIMLIRSMSPQVVATDEIGSRADVDAIYEAVNAGVRMVTTIHGDRLEDILNRPFINEVVKNKVFERLILLSSRYGPGTVEEIIDGTSLRTIISKPFRGGT